MLLDARCVLKMRTLGPSVLRIIIWFSVVAESCKFVSKSQSSDPPHSNYHINTARCQAYNSQHQQTRRPQHFPRGKLCVHVRYAFGRTPKTSTISLARTYAGTNPQFLVLFALPPFRRKRSLCGDFGAIWSLGGRDGRNILQTPLVLAACVIGHH